MDSSVEDGLLPCEHLQAATKLLVLFEHADTEPEVAQNVRALQAAKPAAYDDEVEMVVHGAQGAKNDEFANRALRKITDLKEN